MAELVEDISQFIAGWNQRCEPFIWTKDADTILAKSDRTMISNTGGHQPAVGVTISVAW